jgi:heme A synthase
MKQAPLAIVVFFFLKVVVLTGLLAVFPFVLAVWVVLLHHVGAGVTLTSYFSKASLARAFSSTSRDAIRFSTDISCLVF